MRSAIATLLAPSLIVIAACGGGDGGGGPTGPTSTATAIAPFAGDSQVAAAGTTLPESLAVLVTDTGGHPVADVTVNWSVVGIGGSVSPATTHTNALGIAKAARTLGATAGHGNTNAAVTGLTLLTFAAVGTVQGGVTIASNTVATLTDTILGTLADPEARPSVKVVDQNGHAVAGVAVIWTGGGGGTVGAASVPTDTAGISTVGYTFGSAANSSYQAHATVTGLINSPVNFTLTATHGAPTTIVKSAGDGAFVAPATLVTLTVKATDAHNNAVPGVRVDWVAASGGGTVTPGVDTTNALGLASVGRTLGTASGAQTTTATATTLPGTPAVTFDAVAAHIVKVVNNAFQSNTITIAAGDSVAWAWQGTTAAHNLTFAAGAHVPVDEPDRISGTVYRVFVANGTYTYQCTNHPGMTGTVTVTP